MNALAEEGVDVLLEEHSIRYVDPAELCVLRQRRGKGFTYRGADGTVLRETMQLARFRQLAVPPAWQEVRLAPDECWHLQALGKDQAGRMQRRYHTMWTQIRDAAKRQRLVRFADALAKIRGVVDRDLRSTEMNLDTLSAAAVRLIDLAHLRPGNESAFRDIRSRGTTTLGPGNITVEGRSVRLAFKGKSGQWIESEVSDRTLSQRLAALKDQNRRRLFQFTDEEGVHRLSCADLNAYLQRIAASPVSAKDFRTWDASATAFWLLGASAVPRSEAARGRVLADVSRVVAGRLNNTPAVARNSYIHPVVIDAWRSGFLEKEGASLRLKSRASQWLTRPEVAFRRFLANA